MTPHDRGSEHSPTINSSHGNPMPPLVIVSERGRHTEESRRIVRAQAARASAAQSRITRARNRGEREPATQHEPQGSSSNLVPTATSMPELSNSLQTMYGTTPLALWLPSIMGGAMGALDRRESDPTLSNVLEQTQQAYSSFPFGFSSPAGSEGLTSPVEGGKFQLPLALPRGFSALQQRIQISEALLGLLSRTACIDFGSPGVERRLHQLLFDLIANIAGSALAVQPCHPIQAHLRVACACLTIFQGQRANGAVFATDRKYQTGLEAAWSEATMLDQGALAEPKAAEASLWAVFVITVTTGSNATFFHQRLFTLLQDLQLQYWEQVRRVLLDFIYPVSFLDEPCRIFYDSLLQTGAPLA